ncbi:MAG: sigma-70 family RNA polymerase sigma factor [Planctomycetes bacterium]|jgi:RNA polymerase sigma-70 factor (ECF subfamily)|nr:sigma-70 family RNA polymerase sigma factor [Planctomycetota bacterium]
MQWVTTTHVLAQLKSTDEPQAWGRFCDCFRPVVVEFALKLGLPAPDAEDAAQETMVAFLQALRGGKYDRDKGRLSHWLFGVARRVILNLRDRRPPEQLIVDRTTGTSFWDLIEDDHDLQQSWETQWRQMVLTRSLEQVRREFEPGVVNAFELYALRGMPVEEVTRQLNVSRNAVYIAKSRVLSRLRELAAQFE